jgi:hypothetical protein
MHYNNTFLILLLHYCDGWREIKRGGKFVGAQLEQLADKASLLKADVSRCP